MKKQNLKKQVLFILLIGFLGLIITFTHRDYSLTIIHTNDLHSHFLPVNSHLQDCQNESDCFGGFAKLSTFIAKERKQDPNLLLLDAGDRFSGTYFYTLDKEKDLIPVFQKLKYDVFTLGNHEFDNELSILESFLQNVQTPAMCANIVFPDKSPLKNIVHPSIILEKNGLKIGVIGALTENITHSAMYGDSVQLKPLIDSIQKEIQLQKNQGIHFHILLSHLGLDKDKEMAKNIPELDLIVGGHTHNLLSSTAQADGPYPIIITHSGHNKTYIVTAGALNRFIGKLRLKINNKGQITTAKGDTYPLDQSIEEDSEIKKYVQEKETELSGLLNQHLGRLSESILMTKGKDYCGEICPIADFITKAILKAFPKTDIALINAGSVRSGLSKGPVQLKNLLQVLPFDGTLVSCQIKGKDLMNYIEQGLKNYKENTRVNAFLHISGGHYQFDKKTKKITSLKINNQQIQQDKNYTVILSLFLAKGGDAFPKQKKYQILSKNSIQILSEYLKTHT